MNSPRSIGFAGIARRVFHWFTRPRMLLAVMLACITGIVLATLFNSTTQTNVLLGLMLVMLLAATLQARAEARQTSLSIAAMVRSLSNSSADPATLQAEIDRLNFQCQRIITAVENERHLASQREHRLAAELQDLRIQLAEARNRVKSPVA